MNRQDAIERLQAIPLTDGDYAYFADETRSFYRVDVNDLDYLAKMLSDPLCQDPYSEWCALSSLEPLPKNFSTR